MQKNTVVDQERLSLSSAVGAWEEICNRLVEISCVDAELGDVAAHVRPHMNRLQTFLSTIEQTTETMLLAKKQ